ncbi:family 78 glycoside hydrolase catalytic domain [Butyrivibrio sp. VCB2006]|uniref:family 78 glycoside hydrolase catalytic domain n=1 Tax=Butyrivibrio sp. VCB2006 TaxID=1280679 RepID=UPI000400A8C6|nr:family 78 glycoside hydrolase catalytic domain [Butyrivibrio sp. VCB2006]
MGRNRRRVGAALLGVVMTVSALMGCGAGSDKEASLKADEFENVVFPLIDEYDPGMSVAHFISAPKETDAELEDGIVRPTEYEASFLMAVDGTEASFALGDSNGEYGRVSLYGIRAVEGNECFTFRSFNGGVEDDSYKLEIPLEGENFGIYNVSIAVKDDKARVTVNDKDLGEIDVPKFPLACVGTYKSRGTDTAGIDDIKVTSEGQEVFSESFDGVFVNKLHGYDYANYHGSAFDPMYYKYSYDSKGKSMIITSGFLLSETDKDPARVFKREIDIEKNKVDSAYLYMTALGSYDIELNGQRVSDNFFDPGKMVFDKYLNYVSYNVTDMLEDTNEMNIYLFHGFFDRGVGYPEVAAPWGDTLAVKGELVVNYKDGSKEIIPTDESFSVSRGSRYRFDDIYQGEFVDDRRDINTANDWSNPVVDAVDDKFLSAQIRHKENESIAEWDSFEYVNVSETDGGHFVYDFGQNIAGTIEIDMSKLTGLEDGQVITFRYGEILNDDKMFWRYHDGEDASVWTKGLLSAKSTDYYVCSADKADSQVCFSHTYHGFRYVEVIGLDQEIPVDAIRAIAISSDVEQTGEFSCSDEIINKLYKNSIYSLRANMMDNPTDCAQRDERLGWAGDAQAVSGFAMYAYDTEAFYRNYLKELRTQQGGDGSINDVAPTNNPFGGHSCWGDSITQITWNAYLQYGDQTIIADNIDAAENWVYYLMDRSEDFLLTTEGYGDHLSGQSTPESLTDTAWAAHSARLVARMHEVREDEQLAEIFDGYADEFTKKWQETFIRQDPSVAAGILIADVESETAYALGIAFDLFPEDMKKDAAERLNMLSEYGANLFYPGYSGMAQYLPALAQNGYGNTAVRVLTNTAPGGIAHPLSMGLTTNPEDMGVFRYQDREGNDYPNGAYEVTGSLNHAAYSSVLAFCYSDILGIKPDEKAAGYKHFFVAPTVTESLESAEGSLQTRNGLIKVSWNSTSKEISVTVPENSTCTLMLPGGETKELTGGEHKLNW